MLYSRGGRTNRRCIENRRCDSWARAHNRLFHERWNLNREWRRRSEYRTGDEMLRMRVIALLRRSWRQRCRLCCNRSLQSGWILGQRNKLCSVKWAIQDSCVRITIHRLRVGIGEIWDMNKQTLQVKVHQRFTWGENSLASPALRTWHRRRPPISRSVHSFYTWFTLQAGNTLLPCVVPTPGIPSMTTHLVLRPISEAPIPPIWRSQLPGSLQGGR